MNAKAAVIRDGESFGALRAEWTDVLQHSAANNPFLSWEWLHAWWTHLRGSRTLEIVTVRDEDDRLIGIAPLCASRGRLPWLRRLEFLGTGWAGSDYLDLIVRDGYEFIWKRCRRLRLVRRRPHRAVARRAAQ